ncbi:MAG: SDR family oxidoreductase [Methanobacteriota archaeon]|nr:MAG: SDR family oxidoreductase [Euryarchaeota archaeon]
MNVLVIGALGGIGKATVVRLEEAGYNVISADIPQLSGQHCLPIDVSNWDSVNALFDQLENENIFISGLVNLAGITRDRTLFKMSQEEWDSVISTNLTGSFNVLKRCAEHMRNQGKGSIVMVGSTAALNGNFGQTNYSASKAGIQGLVRSASRELARYGIRINCIIPGLIETPMSAKIPKERMDLLLNLIPLGRAGNPSEVANLINFLISDESSYITGTSILVDGGLRMS